ncbi:MAG TPA: hypothetical protein VII66_02455, partial [Gemmatimonadaceae bacterium]
IAEPVAARPSAPTEQPSDGIGGGGMRLTRDEAFDLMRRAVAHIAKHGGGTRASDVRAVARELLGRDSESLSERNFVRILKDAHDSDIIDLRRRGDDYEVRPAVVAAPIVDQLGAAALANAPARPVNTTPAPRGMGPRGGGGRSQRSGAKTAALPLDLLSVGVVDYDSPMSASVAPVAASSVQPAVTTSVAAPAALAGSRKPARGRKGTAKKALAAPKAAATKTVAAKPAAAKSAKKKTAARR